MKDSGLSSSNAATIANFKVPDRGSVNPSPLGDRVNRARLGWGIGIPEVAHDRFASPLSEGQSPGQNAAGDFSVGGCRMNMAMISG